jgi:hypothetical protein
MDFGFSTIPLKKEFSPENTAAVDKAMAGQGGHGIIYFMFLLRALLVLRGNYSYSFFKISFLDSDFEASR